MFTFVVVIINKKIALRYCILKSCDTTSNAENITLFLFPDNLSKEWIEVVGRGDDWEPKKTRRLAQSILEHT